MSLLMDALKKAEQEKREAAKRLKETEGPLDSTGQQDRPESFENQDASGSEATGPHSLDRESPTMELSLAPIEERRQREPESEAEQTSGEKSRKDHARRVETDEDAGVAETIGDKSLRLTLDGAGTETGEREIDAEEPAADEADSSLAEEMDREESEADPDQTFHGLDMDTSMERARYEETVREDVQGSDKSRVYDETLPGVSALQMAADIGGEDQPTPVAAETIFTAGSTTRQRSPVVKWFMIGTTVVMILAAAVWYYYTVTPINRQLPSPMVARGVERTPPEPSEIQAPEQTVVQSGTLGVGDTTGAEADSGTTEAAKTPAGETETPAAGASDAAAASVAEEPATPQTPSENETPSQTAMDSGNPEQPQPAPASDDGAPATDEESGQEAVAAVGEQEQRARNRLPESIEPPPSMIRISRSKAPEQQGILLKEAYHSYTNGDYRAAAENYKKVLNEHPDNRDALLGQAAVALKQDESERALRLYARVLQLNPRDNLARAALISLSKGTDARQSESTIKLMLQDNPDLAYLHFALGNVYAAQSRWADAQQAFFDAYRLNSANADYAANLAVSLDHMGKPDSALDYYRKALELAGEQASFNPSSLKARIATLEGAGQP